MATQESNTMTMSYLRNDRTFATISQFFHTFQSAYHPWPNYTDSQWASLLHRPPSTNIKSDAAQDDYVFSTEDLEDMLMDTSRRYQLEELFVRMLRLLTRNRFVSVSTWQEYLSREWDRREPDQVNPFHVVNNSPSSPQLTADTTITNDQLSVTQNESIAIQSNKKIRSFFDLPMETRLVLLNALCEWQLDEPERLREHLNNEEDATQWRVDPIGYDTKGNTFWLFDDNRLYKEAAPLSKKKATHRKKKKSLSQATRRNTRRSTRTTSKPDESLQEEEEDDDNDEEWVPWKLVCMTVDEWQQFPKKYSKSQYAQDQQFHQLLVDDVLPKVIPVIEDHEKERKKQEAILYRKRSSRILVRELEALEQHAAETDFELSQSQQQTPSRSEQRRLQKEAEEKERQVKAREERMLERERKLFAKAQAEERAAEKARLDRERRLQRRHGGNNMNGEQDIMMAQDTSLQQQQQQGFKLTLTVGDPKKKKKGANDPMLGKRKRGRKPKVRLQEDDEESWTFRCTCGVFGKNIDDGTPMIACERCDEWQHIDCLRKSGQVDTKLASFDDLTFICRRCTEKEAKEEIDVDDTNITINERMINTTIQKAMPTPPDTTSNNGSLLPLPPFPAAIQPADYQHHSSLTYPHHFLHQQQQQPIRSLYTPPPLKPFSSSSSSSSLSYGNSQQLPSSVHTGGIPSSSHHQTPLPPISRSLGEHHQHYHHHHEYGNRHQQQQQQQYYYPQYNQQQQQQRTLSSLPQHLELDPLQTSSSSPFPSTTNSITSPTKSSMVTIENTEVTHKMMPPH